MMQEEVGSVPLNLRKEVWIKNRCQCTVTVEAMGKDRVTQEECIE